MDAAFLLTVGSFLLTVELFYLQLTSLAYLFPIGCFLCLQLEFLFLGGSGATVHLESFKRRPKTVHTGTYQRWSKKEEEGNTQNKTIRNKKISLAPCILIAETPSSTQRKVVWTLLDERRLQASEVLDARLLGFRIGPGVPAHVWDEVLQRIDARAVLIHSVSFGAPASIRMGRLVLWTMAFRCLSMHTMEESVRKRLERHFHFIVRGPRGWLSIPIMRSLHLLGWPASLPALEDESIRARLCCCQTP